MLYRILGVQILIIASFGLLLLAGCGGSNPATAPGATATYGTLTLSGTGSSTTGSTFNAITLSNNPSGGYSWMNYTGGSLAYPAITVSTAQISGNVAVVQIVCYTSATTYYVWTNSDYNGVPGATLGTNSIAFNNVVLTGTSTSLTINGTLRF